MVDYDIHPTRPNDLRQGPGKVRFNLQDLDRAGASIFVPRKPEGETNTRLATSAFASLQNRGFDFKIKTQVRVENGISGIRIWRL